MCLGHDKAYNMHLSLARLSFSLDKQHGTEGRGLDLLTRPQHQPNLVWHLQSTAFRCDLRVNSGTRTWSATLSPIPSSVASTSLLRARSGAVLSPGHILLIRLRRWSDITTFLWLQEASLEQVCHLLAQHRRRLRKNAIYYRD